MPVIIRFAFISVLTFFSQKKVVMSMQWCTVVSAKSLIRKRYWIAKYCLEIDLVVDLLVPYLGENC